MKVLNKKVWRILFMLVLFFGIIGVRKLKVQAQEVYISGEWEYTVLSGEVTLTKYNGSSLSIVIPSMIDGYPVTEIGECIFEGSTITSLNIPSSIEKINNKAFADCKYLSYIYFDAKDCYVFYFRSMQEMHVFKNAGKFSDSLKIEFGPNVKNIPASMFEASSDDYAHVTDVIISDSVEKINAWAFGNCYDLQNVKWGKNIQRIEYGAFCDCTKLLQIEIPETTEYIGLNAFRGCKYLQKIEFNAKNCDVYMMRSSQMEHVFVEAGKFSDSLIVIFGKNVESIPSSLFEAPDKAYAHITEVIIPSTVKELESFTFNNCLDLKTITIKGKTSIPINDWENPFSGCNKNLVFRCLRGTNADKYATQYKFQKSYLNTVAPKISSIKNSAKNTFIIKWKKVSGVSGYEIQYSKSKHFTDSKVIKKVTSLTKKVSSLSQKQKYYVRVRTYNITDNETYYSFWSKVKTVTISK